MAKTIDTLAVKAVLDVTQVADGAVVLKKEVSEASRIITQMQTPLERLEAKEQRLNELFRRGAVNDIPAYTRAMQELRRQKDALSGSQGLQIASMLPGVGTLIAGFTSASGAISLVTMAFSKLEQAGRAAVEFVVEAGKRIDEVDDSAARLGISVGALSQLQVASQFADVASFDSVTSAMERMLVSVSNALDPNSDMAKTFANLGLDAKELLGLSMDQQFERIAIALSSVGNNAQRLDMMREILGKSSGEIKTLIENFDELNRRAIESGGVLTEDQAAQVRAAADAMIDMQVSLDSLGNTAATTFAPALSAAATYFKGMLEDSEKLTNTILVMSPLLTLTGQAQEIAEAIKMSREESLRGARLESELRKRQGPSEEQEMANRAQLEKIEQDSQKKVTGDFDRSTRELEKEIILLRDGRDAWDERRDTLAGFNYEQRYQLQLLREELGALEAAKFAQEQDVKLKKERVQEAERIRDANRTEFEAAADRISQAMDLITTGELDNADVEKLAEREAKKLVGDKGQEFRLQAKTFGSQEAIAATLGRRAETDSERLESMRQSLLRIAGREPIEVQEVSL